MTTNAKLQDLSFGMAKTYLYAGLFVAGNLVLPQLAHLIPNWGPMLLPIYFFTLIAAYKFGWKTGLMTAVLSPVLNYLIFGMPLLAMLPVILIKSTLLVGAAAFAASYFKKVTLLTLLGVVLAYQITGTLIEWAIVGDFFVAVQDFRIGIAGMAVQIVGGRVLIKSE